jgi:hypothetical protein
MKVRNQQVAGSNPDHRLRLFKHLPCASQSASSHRKHGGSTRRRKRALCGGRIGKGKDAVGFPYRAAPGNAGAGALLVLGRGGGFGARGYRRARSPREIPRAWRRRMARLTTDEACETGAEERQLLGYQELSKHSRCQADGRLRLARAANPATTSNAVLGSGTYCVPDIDVRLKSETGLPCESNSCIPLSVAPKLLSAVP